jgi:hypothetical protein
MGILREYANGKSKRPRRVAGPLLFVVHLIGAGDRDPQQVTPGMQSFGRVTGEVSFVRSVPERFDARLGVPVIFGMLLQFAVFVAVVDAAGCCAAVAP